MWVALCSSKHERSVSFKDGDPIDDAMTSDDATSAFTSPRCRAESFFRMKDLAGDVGVDVGVAVVGVAERDFPGGWAIG